jgi:hypothetical protein
VYLRLGAISLFLLQGLDGDATENSLQLSLVLFRAIHQLQSVLKWKIGIDKAAVFISSLFSLFAPFSSSGKEVDMVDG